MGLIKDVSTRTGLSAPSCRRIAHSAYKRYKFFLLPKKSGGQRLVAQPAREVKEVQRAICSIIAPLLPIHRCATAYNSGNSIIKNAELHLGAKYLTKLDFSEFFPSIEERTVRALLSRNINEISDSEATFIIRACMWRPRGRFELCLGAPSSPFISNAVMYDFDSLVADICSSKGVIYSRYSDDITISCDRPDTLGAVESEMQKVISSHALPRLTLNNSKRVAVGRSAAMRVTGLTLANNGVLTVGRERKRGVRAGVSRYAKGLLPQEDFERLKGELAFVLSVEPTYKRTLLRTYGARIFPLLPRVKDSALQY
ncbi:retron St85 family RNA-directed DNA polymerase [Xanthomonas campestris]|uniref:retron St85 family RNA-directed DNA polymerase n=1 Tax=Xanthomonas campestris TaxID=339 RepID=UPI0039C10835